MGDVTVRCTICDVEVALTDEPGQRVAQIRAFAAAHDHDPQVTLLIRLVDGDAESEDSA